MIPQRGQGRSSTDENVTRLLASRSLPVQLDPLKTLAINRRLDDCRAKAVDRDRRVLAPCQNFADIRPAITHGGGGRDMAHQDAGFDYDRYRQLLVEAVDERKRLALINLLIEERAMERLADHIASDRAAMTAAAVANVVRARRI